LKSSRNAAGRYLLSLIRAVSLQQSLNELHHANRNNQEGPASGKGKNPRLLERKEYTYRDQEHGTSCGLRESGAATIHGAFP
jgi:hypothetical protein